jgi:hypothetical protein
MALSAANMRSWFKLVSLLRFELVLLVASRRYSRKPARRSLMANVEVGGCRDRAEASALLFGTHRAKVHTMLQSRVFIFLNRGPMPIRDCRPVISRSPCHSFQRYEIRDELKCQKRKRLLLDFSISVTGRESHFPQHLILADLDPLSFPLALSKRTQIEEPNYNKRELPPSLNDHAKDFECRKDQIMTIPMAWSHVPDAEISVARLGIHRVCPISRLPVQITVRFSGVEYIPG